MLVDKDRFVTDVSVPWAKKNYDLYQRTLPDLRDTREAMHLRDKGAGAFLAVFTLAPSKRELISMVDSFFPLSVSLACGEEISEEFFQFIASCSNGKKVHNTDWWMFRFVINYMAKISPDDGFDPYQFIESISNAAREADESISNEITRWCDYVKKVLDGDTGVPQLSDTGNVVQRAVMLFLLRPKIDRMENAPDTALHPGPVVYTIATFLIGFYTGAVRLGLPYKQSYNNFTSFMEYFLKSVSQKLNGIKWTRSHIAIEAQDAILSSKAIFKVRDENILYKEMKPNPVLARVYYQAKTAGYPLEYDCAQDALMCQVEIEEERSQTVRVMCVSVNHHGDEVIRFSSPCMNFKTKKAIKREMAIDLLERNNELDMHCRFALNNERNEIVVQVDQVVMNMDDGELKAHIENVARIAGNYEKQVSNVDKY